MHKTGDELQVDIFPYVECTIHRGYAPLAYQQAEGSGLFTYNPRLNQSAVAEVQKATRAMKITCMLEVLHGHGS